MKLTIYKEIIEKLLKISYFPIVKAAMNSDDSPKRVLTRELKQIEVEEEQFDPFFLNEDD